MISKTITTLPLPATPRVGAKTVLEIFLNLTIHQLSAINYQQSTIT